MIVVQRCLLLVFCGINANDLLGDYPESPNDIYLSPMTRQARDHGPTSDADP